MRIVQAAIISRFSEGDVSMDDIDAYVAERRIGDHLIEFTAELRMPKSKNQWEVSFGLSDEEDYPEGEKFNLTGDGNAIAVLGWVRGAWESFIKEHNPGSMTFNCADRKARVMEGLAVKAAPEYAIVKHTQRRKHHYFEMAKK